MTTFLHPETYLVLHDDTIVCWKKYHPCALVKVKAKKALREKHEEQLSATGIRREAERVADEVQAP